MKVSAARPLQTLLRSPERVLLGGREGGNAAPTLAERWLGTITFRSIRADDQVSLESPRLALVPRREVVVLHVQLPTRSRREIERMVPFQVERHLPVQSGEVCWTVTPFPAEKGVLARIEVVRNAVLDRCLEGADWGIVETWALVPRLRRLTQEPRVTAIVAAAGSQRWITIQADHLLLDEPIDSVDTDYAAMAEELSARLGMAIPTPTHHLEPCNDETSPEPAGSDGSGDQEGSSLLRDAGAITLKGAPVFENPRRRGSRWLRRVGFGVIGVLLACLLLAIVDQWQQFKLLHVLQAWRTEHKVEIQDAEALREDAIRQAARPDARSYSSIFESLRRAAGAQLHLEYVEYRDPAIFHLVGWAGTTRNVLDFASALEADSLWAHVAMDMVRAHGEEPCVLFEAQAQLAK